jgi:AcrR family transcriptional regulator
MAMTSALPERNYGGRSADERRRDRRERLIAAGLELFATEGYAATTVQRICDEAGVIARYFYESFETREALLTEVFFSIVGETVSAVSRSLSDAPDDPVERTKRAIGAFVHSYLDDPRRGRIVCLEVGGVSPALERLRWTEMERFTALVEAECERLAEQGLLPRRDSRMGGVALAGATNQLIVDYLSSKNPPSIEALEYECVLLFVTMLEGLSSAVKRLERDEARGPKSLRGAPARKPARAEPRAHSARTPSRRRP